MIAGGRLRTIDRKLICQLCDYLRNSLCTLHSQRVIHPGDTSLGSTDQQLSATSSLFAFYTGTFQTPSLFLVWSVMTYQQGVELCLSIYGSTLSAQLIQVLAGYCTVAQPFKDPLDTCSTASTSYFRTKVLWTFGV